MTLSMCCEITFEKTSNRGEIKISKPSAVQIEQSWKQLTDRATVVLPRNIQSFDKQRLNEVFKRGDAIEIKLGYDGKLQKVFTGYISRVGAGIPVKLECEDKMWKLKQQAVNFSSKDIKLKSLLEALCPDAQVKAPDLALGSVRFSKTTLAKTLERLQQDWGLYAYFKDDVLVCGTYCDNQSPPVAFHLERNCVSQSLNYKKKEDVMICLKAISILKNGKKLEVELGDKQGAQRQLTYYNIQARAELEKLAKKDYDHYKSDGFEGKFIAFGLPYVTHGQKVSLKSEIYPDREGVYYVDSVKRSFDGSSGYRQEITLGNKVKANSK